jgi:hypothetical protein
MRLYHGTNGSWLENILKNGLEPRRRIKSRNNWTHVKHQSNPGAVYLTDSYAPYFSFNASRGQHPSCAVVEIDTDKLDNELLSYDEDAWEQIGRAPDKAGRTPRDGVAGDMSQRTLHYRRKQRDWESQYQFSVPGHPEWRGWQVSLFALGTCCYLGDVPPEAITRAVRWPHKPNIWMAFVWDPTISMINQRIMGDRYRALTAMLFGGEIPNNLPEWDLPQVKGFKPDKINDLERFDLQVKELQCT